LMHEKDACVAAVGWPAHHTGPLIWPAARWTAFGSWPAIPDSRRQGCILFLIDLGSHRCYFMQTTLIAKASRRKPQRAVAIADISLTVKCLACDHPGVPGSAGTCNRFGCTAGLIPIQHHGRGLRVGAIVHHLLMIQALQVSASFQYANRPSSREIASRWFTRPTRYRPRTSIAP